jgi:soluble cytochrome b562
MAVSGVSSSSNNNYQSSPLTDLRQAFQQMAKAINSGDLTGAQQAYTTLAQMQDGGSGVPTDTSSPFAQALNQIGQALQNGDINGAQQALSSLSQQTHAHHHHHHARPSSDSSPSDAGSTNADTSGSTGGNVNLTV